MYFFANAIGDDAVDTAADKEVNGERGLSGSAKLRSLVLKKRLNLVTRHPLVWSSSSSSSRSDALTLTRRAQCRAQKTDDGRVYGQDNLARELGRTRVM